MHSQSKIMMHPQSKIMMLSQSKIMMLVSPPQRVWASIYRDERGSIFLAMPRELDGDLSEGSSEGVDGAARTQQPLSMPHALHKLVLCIRRV